MLFFFLKKYKYLPNNCNRFWADCKTFVPLVPSGGGKPDPELSGQGQVTSCCHHEWRRGEGGAQENEAGTCRQQ